MFINTGYFNEFSIMYSSYIFMFIWGFNFLNNINKEIHKPSKAFSFLTLPTSHFERTLVTWLVSSLFYTVIYTIIIYYVIDLSAYFTYQFSNATEYTPVFKDVLKFSLYYMVFHTAYFFGSIFFKRNQFIKTSLCIIILFTIVIFAIILSDKLIIFNIWNGGTEHLPNFRIITPDIFRFEFIDIITFYFSPVALLTATYFRINEKQI
ncbi:MAG TPA: hypothetical protein PKK00_03110 [Bacteroidales bacterium]|nr:hypothetical protein [Bacteroidales bacterium]HPS15690.1 hypothetical protein [Bacteroidales bacterium]